MDLSGRHIDSISDTKGLLLNLAVVKRIIIGRIGDGEIASSDQMSCYVVVRMRRIVSAALSDFVDC